MKLIKLILDESGKIALCCPHCSVRYRSESFRFVQYIGQKITTSCKKCGEKFGIEVKQQAQRRYARKLIDHTEVGATILGTLVAIKDISRTGLRFVYCKGRAYRHDVGSTVQMKIDFPGHKLGAIDYELEVMNISNDGFGCRFLNTHSGSRAGKAIGFYLLDVAQREKRGKKDG